MYRDEIHTHSIERLARLRRRLRPFQPSRLLHRLVNRRTPQNTTITLHTAWPLYLLPWLAVMVLIDPSPLWVTLFVGVAGFYGVALFWVRQYLSNIELDRSRQGSMLVAGDELKERFLLHNHSPLPLLWLALEDDSILPGYTPSRVTSCEGRSQEQWTSTAICQQRGVFRLGPHTLYTGDPFGLFRLTVEHAHTDSLLVYPRVVYLPPISLPRGDTPGRDRRRRPRMGNLRSAVVRAYQPGDGLRQIHWPSTAHRGDLMVAEREEEPSGDLWIALDLNHAAQQGSGPQSTLEHSIVLAASLAAELLGSSERRAVGLLAAGHTAFSPDQESEQVIALPPRVGSGQIWRILAALAPIQAGTVSGADLLRQHRDMLGRGHTLVLITAQGDEGAALWLAELLRLRRSGVESSVILVTADNEADPSNVAQPESDHAHLHTLLAQHDIPLHVLAAGAPMQAALTYRRRRTVLRSTPTGGVVVMDVEEEVG